MTRINVVPVEELSRLHLIAEYRELPRIFGLAHKASQSDKPWTHKQPKEYTLGTGHVIFFYDRLEWLSERHKQLTGEMIARGYKPSFTGCLKDEWQGKIPKGYWKGYNVTDDALKVNRARVAERLKEK